MSPSRLDDIARGVLADEQPTRELRVRFDLLPWTGRADPPCRPIGCITASQISPRRWSLCSCWPSATRASTPSVTTTFAMRALRRSAMCRRTSGGRFGACSTITTRYVDSLVGDAMASLAEGDLLLVVSGFGMEPLTVGKRVLERVAGDPRFSGTHDRGPDGFLHRAGTLVLPGVKAAGQSLTSRPRSSISLGCPSRATWMASRAPISSQPPSTNNARSRSFRRVRRPVDSRVHETAIINSLL